jgi:hypothetical protein
VARLTVARVRWIVPVVACALVLASCSSGGTSGAAASHGNDVKFGASAQAGSGVTYQPDVVFVGGSSSVVAVSANGLIWTISNSAPNVPELRTGKIMFASSLGVGRILAVSKTSTGTRVVLGPVNITDIVRDGDFSSTAPISLDSAEGYSAPTEPGLVTGGTSTTTPTDGSSGNSGAQSLGGATTRTGTITVPPVHFVADSSGSARQATLTGLDLQPGSTGFPPPTPTPSASNVGAYHLTPFCCAGGVGVHVGYNANGLKLSATVSLALDKPSVGFDLKIAGGKLVNAAVELHGAGGFRIGLTAASTTGLAGDVKSQRVEIPVDFSVPITSFGIPLTIGFDQVFGLTAAFTAHPSAFTANGAYSFGGTLGFGLHNGSPSVYVPSTVTAATDPSSNMSLLSVGPAAVLINYQAKVSVGVGLLGFRTGVWFAVAFNTGLTAAGATSEIPCRKTAFAMFDEYGVGYSIPKPVVALVNTFLKVFHSAPIQASGGFMSQPATVVDKSSTVPAVAACG